ncbi:MAG: LysR family transcriptional regulator [Nannocystaceae bacterium]|nr:LysR family transcriptional regulator [Nannocystaceae bacterium]
MDRLGAMEVLVRVVDEGSFAGAARALRVSAPSVTRAVASLEDHLDTQLLTRTTRRLALTDAGRRYVEDCRRILSELNTAEAAATGAFVRAKGTLHITAPVMFGQTHVLPILGEFLDLHPAVDARTLFLDRIVHLIDEGMDVAVRIGHLPDSSLRAIRVGSVRSIVVAAPHYLEEHGPPLEPEDLLHHDIVAVSRSSAPSVKWDFATREAQGLTLEPRLCANTIATGLHAAESGWGVTRLLSYQVHEAIAAGRLVRVLADAERGPIPVHLVHPDARHVSAKVRAFLEFASTKLRARLAAISKAFP